MDELYYFDWARNIALGSFPVGDSLYQYPPGAGLLFYALDLLPGSFHRSFTALMVLADVAILVLLIGCVGVRGDSWRGAWVWVVGGFLAGPLLYERFDVIPTILAVLALINLTRPMLVGGLAGLGVMLKVWPGLALLGLPRSQLVKGISGLLAGVVGVGIAALVIADGSLGFLGNQVARGLQVESSGAAVLVLGDLLGVTRVTTVDEFGASQVSHPSAALIGWISLTVGSLLMLALLALRLWGRLESIPGSDVVLLAVLVLIVFNKVNSPQFFIWAAGVAAVALLNHRTIMTVPVILLGLSMLPSREYIGIFYWSLQAVQPMAVGFQVLRVLLLTSALTCAWVLLIRAIRAESSSRIHGVGAPR